MGISAVKRLCFVVLGFVGLGVLAFKSYQLYRRTGTASHDIWFAIHLPAYLLTACVCVGLVRAGFSSDDWHTFVTNYDHWFDD